MKDLFQIKRKGNEIHVELNPDLFKNVYCTETESTKSLIVGFFVRVRKLNKIVFKSDFEKIITKSGLANEMYVETNLAHIDLFEKCVYIVTWMPKLIDDVEKALLELDHEQN